MNGRTDTHFITITLMTSISSTTTSNTLDAKHYSHSTTGRAYQLRAEELSCLQYLSAALSLDIKMNGRIYIRDFSYDATAEDLSALISKVCPVEEVYISGKTPTGINRSFAIVVLNGTDLLVEKCIKTFNNCHWKGTKIWVEKAKVYYKDKFEMERARERKIAAMRLQRAENVEEEAELDDFQKSLLAEIDAGDAEPDAIENDDTVPESVIVIKKVKSSLKHVIKLKKSRDSIPVAISMVPTSSSTASGDIDSLLIWPSTIASAEEM